MFNVFLDPKADPLRIADAVSRSIPGHVVTFDGSQWAPEPPPPIVVGFGLLGAAAQAPEVEDDLAAIPGVSEVESFFLRRAHIFPGWFDAHLEATPIRTTEDAE
jgi:hypothetical protein